MAACCQSWAQRIRSDLDTLQGTEYSYSHWNQLCQVWVITHSYIFFTYFWHDIYYCFIVLMWYDVMAPFGIFGWQFHVVLLGQSRPRKKLLRFNRMDSITSSCLTLKSTEIDWSNILVLWVFWVLLTVLLLDSAEICPYRSVWIAYYFIFGSIWLSMLTSLFVTW